MKILQNRMIQAWLVSGLAVLILVNSTTPDRIGPQGVTVFFMLFYIWMFFSVEILLRIIAKSDHARSLKQTRHFTVTAVVATIPTFVLALQSLGQLVLRDIIILFSLVAIVIFYWTKRG